MTYKIKRVKIDGFWHRFDAECDFNLDVNIIIGKNGSGKTTFMNILHAILAVDIDGIRDNDFDSVEIKLVSGPKRLTIKAQKIEQEKTPFTVLEYQVSKKRYPVRITSSDERGMSPSYRRRVFGESAEIRDVLDELVSLSSLSVYRLRSDDDYEIRDRRGSRILSPVDYRLAEALRGLTHYQLELSQSARSIASKLQKDVLASILYSEEDAGQESYSEEFDKKKEERNLFSAYEQLNAIDTDIKKKISFHVQSIDQAVRKLGTKEGEIKKQGKSSKIKNNSENADFRPLEALRKTRKIIEMSLKSEGKTKQVFSQIQLFLEIIESFITDKNFNFDSGELTISNEQGSIPHTRLSSGEKQLLILLVEALLQNQQPHIFLADEPELSLHIEWQRMVIPAIRKLNPSAQVIAATHSPEVASNYRKSIFNMEALING